MKHIHTFEEFLNENLNESKELPKPKDFLMLVWQGSSRPAESPTYVYVSDKEENLSDFPKGELADMIEKDHKVRIRDAGDLEVEVISYKDFMDDYGSPKNPHTISLLSYDIKRI